MNVYLFAALIALAIFLLILAGYFVARYLLGNRRKKSVYKSSFVRADINLVKDTEQIRGSGSLKDRPAKQGRGRFYAFGVLIAALFGTLTVRLWGLQILGYKNFIKLSSENMTSEVTVPANRGRILDRYGNELVGNRPSITVTGKRGLTEDGGLIHRLSLVLGIPVGIIRRNLLNDAEGAQSDHTIARDVPMESIAYIREHPTLFKGINVESRTVRYYPYGTLGAHVLGYTGPVTEEFLKNQTGDEPIPYKSGDIIGKDGAELTFERILQGMHGAKIYKVDAAGNPVELASEIEPVSGDDVVLTLDASLQRETDKILMDIINMVRNDTENKNCNAGALICIDVEDGSILASSSYPTYFPSDLTGGISTELWEELTSEESGYPLTNRAVSGEYPAASTFKIFTSLAGLQNNMITDDTEFYCDGFWVYDRENGDQWGQRCWIYPRGHGRVGLEESINVSCDFFFYSVGAAFYDQWESYALEANGAIPQKERPNPFQDYIATWGFGAPTGVDMPGEAQGRIPTAAWKLATFSDTPEDARWQPGDMTNMCIGQGDILVTPLQLLNGYTTFARQKAVTPHIFSHVINTQGDAVSKYKAVAVETQPEYEKKYHDRVMDGVKRVVEREGGFSEFPVQVAGKTGTAEVAGRDDYSWFVAFAPADQPKYCAICLIEQGGSGALVAMNGVIQTFARIYEVDAGEIRVWQNRER
ncbi:MAG: penicillin-binding protein 2 [Coriobacteriales bacterium]|jgi:penicillin-binding protein 2|nr:penicillin-binding protein 2 [Coriobacteriales bacterium]